LRALVFAGKCLTSALAVVASSLVLSDESWTQSSLHQANTNSVASFALGWLYSLLGTSSIATWTEDIPLERKLGLLAVV
jgi:hypothetical protein